MALAPGTVLGPYEIGAKLGAGGMGEVYRARDTRLDRAVAIKVLSPLLANDPGRKQRFEREAKIISSLNHPHICVVHDVGNQDGIDYLVMEYVEGETLADRLARGPLALAQVLEFGAQIANALDVAHRSGIVHRDLKPGNIMLTSTGTKLLDFGLAKSTATPLTGSTMTAATIDAPVTEEGTIVGTFQYMSPEQVEGKELDGRSDIFSLGAVLYEMVTGRRAFQGKSALSVAAAILEKEPQPISEIKPLSPAALDHTIAQCLAKSVSHRWQVARDLALELKWMAEPGALNSSPASALQGARKPRNRALIWAALAFLGAALALNAYLLWTSKPATSPITKFEMTLPRGAANFTLSPDGRRLVILAPGPDGRHMLWLRSLDSLETQPMPGTENVLGPPVFWSPDSRFVAFQALGKLRKIDVSGGPPQDICDTAYAVLGGAWSRDDTILIGTDSTGIVRVPAWGGTPVPVTTTGNRNEVHSFPSFLPDGKHFVYLRAPENPGIYVGSIDTKPEQQSATMIVGTPVMSVYATFGDRGGRLLFLREGTLMAQHLDERQFQLQGDPFPVASQIGSYLLSAGFTVSGDKVLAFRSGKTASPTSKISWFDRQGKALGDVGDEGAFSYNDLALSPDGERIAATRISGAGSHMDEGIWIIDVNRGTSTRFTQDTAPDVSPVWSPDGKRIAFSAARSGGMAIYQKAVGGDHEELLIGASENPKYASDWSRDGRFLLYTQQSKTTNYDLCFMRLNPDGTPAGSPQAFIDDTYNEGQGQFSPDGKWVAYASDESGNSEVYVRQFGGARATGAAIRISRGGGSEPRWHRDGKELFYLTREGKVTAVEVKEGGELSVGTPQELFQATMIRVANLSDFSVFHWDVAADGKRFLIDATKGSSDALTVVMNWAARLEQK
jgi:serine/threonine protein kinase/Tol biopolymer transport system component